MRLPNSIFKLETHVRILKNNLENKRESLNQFASLPNMPTFNKVLFLPFTIFVYLVAFLFWQTLAYYRYQKTRFDPKTSVDDTTMEMLLIKSRWLCGSIKDICLLLSETRNNLRRETADLYSVPKTDLIPWRYKKQMRQGCPLPEHGVQHDIQGQSARIYKGKDIVTSLIAVRGEG